MDKQKLIEAVCSKIEEDLNVIKVSAQAAHEAATDSESKAENQYDTRGLEASYLADAQSKRAIELEEVLHLCRSLPLKNFTETESIAATALVEILLNRRRSWVFLLPKGAGMSVDFEGRSIQTISIASPLGEALMGLKKDEISEVEQGDVTRELKILSVK